VSERRQVGIEATCVAILVGYKPSEMRIPTITFANGSSVSDYVDPLFQGISRICAVHTNTQVLLLCSGWQVAGHREKKAGTKGGPGFSVGWLPG
jgi:hypothetical protein